MAKSIALACGELVSSAFLAYAVAAGIVTGCGKTAGQAESLPHHRSQMVDPWWWRRRFRLRIGCSEAFFRQPAGRRFSAIRQLQIREPRVLSPTGQLLL